MQFNQLISCQTSFSGITVVLQAFYVSRVHTGGFILLWLVEAFWPYMGHRTYWSLVKPYGIIEPSQQWFIWLHPKWEGHEDKWNGQGEISPFSRFWDSKVLSCPAAQDYWYLTHWGRVTHICISKLTIIGSDNGLSPDRRQAIIWTNDGLLLIGPLGTNFSEIVIKVSSAKRRPFCLGLNVLKSLPHMVQLQHLCADYVKGATLNIVTKTCTC